MRRSEAAQLFKEICKCIPDVSVNSVSLTSSDFSNKEYALKMNLDLDAKSLESVQSVVSKSGLLMKKDSGFLLIYGSKRKRSGLEIVA